MVDFRGHQIPNISPMEMNNRIIKFEKVYKEQLPIIYEKLQIAEPKCKIIISNYAEDTLKMREMVDKLIELRKKKGIVSKLRLTKFLTVQSRLFMLFSLKTMKKWKKYDSDIVNFPVKDCDLND